MHTKTAMKTLLNKTFQNSVCSMCKSFFRASLHFRLVKLWYWAEPHGEAKKQT